MRSASALARSNRVRLCVVAPRADMKTKRSTPARSAAPTMRHVAIPLSSSIEPFAWSRGDPARWMTVSTPRIALRNDGGSARSPRAICTRTRSAPSSLGSRTRQRTGMPWPIRRVSRAAPTVPEAPVRRSISGPFHASVPAWAVAGAGWPGRSEGVGPQAHDRARTPPGGDRRPIQAGAGARGGPLVRDGLQRRALVVGRRVAGDAGGGVGVDLVERLAREQRRGQRIEVVAVLGEQDRHVVVGVVDDAAYLLVDELLRRPRGLRGAGQQRALAVGRQ